MHIIRLQVFVVDTARCDILAERYLVIDVRLLHLGLNAASSRVLWLGISLLCDELAHIVGELALEQLLAFGFGHVTRVAHVGEGVG